MDKKNEAGLKLEAQREVKQSRRKIILLVVLAAAILIVGGALAILCLTGVLGGGLDDEREGTSADSAVTTLDTEEQKMEDAASETAVYSVLTGLPISDEAINREPTFCVQVPNGTDGARPQAGLDKAGVIFEAIAEKGITRFAAIFQDVEQIAAIGPLRSLRLYYLQWDAPFDCTVVHDGGADDALAAVKAYKDFTAFGGFVWRSSSNSKLNRRWNNEFTSGDLLLQYNAKRGYGDSDVKGLARLTPAEALQVEVDATATNPLDIDTETDTSTSERMVQAGQLTFEYGNMPNYNPTYNYDAETNTYKRGYQSGAEHKIYNCDGQSGKLTPETSCTETQLAPSVVVAMMVEEKRAADNYHENITTLGSGKAYIFQGGMVIEATWRKPTVADQIKFYDATETEIKLAPGQTMISAIPTYGKVTYQ